MTKQISDIINSLLENSSYDDLYKEINATLAYQQFRDLFTKVNISKYFDKMEPHHSQTYCKNIKEHAVYVYQSYHMSLTSPYDLHVDVEVRTFKITSPRMSFVVTFTQHANSSTTICFYILDMKPNEYFHGIHANIDVEHLCKSKGVIPDKYLFAAVNQTNSGGLDITLSKTAQTNILATNTLHNNLVAIINEINKRPIDGLKIKY